MRKWGQREPWSWDFWQEHQLHLTQNLRKGSPSANREEPFQRGCLGGELVSGVLEYIRQPLITSPGPQPPFPIRSIWVPAVLVSTGVSLLICLLRGQSQEIYIRHMCMYVYTHLFMYPSILITTSLYRYFQSFQNCKVYFSLLPFIFIISFSDSETFSFHYSQYM